MLSNVRFRLEHGKTFPTVAVVRCENRCLPSDRENRELFAHESSQRNLRYCHKPENQTDRDHASMTLSDARDRHSHGDVIHNTEENLHESHSVGTCDDRDRRGHEHR